MHIYSHFAYLDAGTGSLIVQSLIGIFAGITVFGRRVIGNITHKVAAIFGRGKKSESKIDG